jgi:hypothetical protein
MTLGGLGGCDRPRQRGSGLGLGDRFVAKAIASSVTRWMTKAIVREMRAFRATQV